MNELTLPITDLKTKIEKLVSLHQQIKKDKEQLYSENEALQKTIDKQTITIESLQKNNQELTQNKNEEQNKIVTDTKVKINELVQEIDNCIALLK
jgi:predicted nuclease with TOPRIM domain